MLRNPRNNPSCPEMLNVHFFLLLLVPLAVSCLMPVSANSEVRALMDLKAAMDPANRYLGTWTVDGDPCAAGNFAGVACNDKGKVANISLQGKGLAGELSPAIGGLTSLSGLYLHFNSLTGEIPRELYDLRELTDLYLDVNNLTGGILPEIAGMQSLQVLQLSCNQLTGTIPAQIGHLKKLSVLAISYNRLSGSIPPTLGNLMVLRALYLSSNNFSGPIPINIANIPQLQSFDIRNNSLTGIVPPALKKLNGGFLYSNNSGLCSQIFPSLRRCTAFDVVVTTTSAQQPLVGPLVLKNHTTPTRTKQAANSSSSCNEEACSNTARSSQAIIVSGLIVATIMLAAAGFFAFFRYRRRKQKIGNSADASADRRLSTDCTADLRSKSASPLVSLVYSNGWDPLADGLNSDEFPQEVLQNFRFNMEDVQSATQYFSQANVLGKGGFSTVYRGNLRDGSTVAIKRINASSCKAEEDEFVKGMKLLLSLRHENLIFLKGFCCSKARGECFLIYEFAPNGTLARYLNTSDHGGCSPNMVLDWPTRVSLIHGIAKGVHYLHNENGTKPALIHRNLSAEKILLDHRFKPLITDSGLQKILADDLMFSALKVSAAMGYLAPEYIKTGHFTHKSDMYSFGVIVLQILSGKQKIPSGTMARPDHPRLDEIIDPNLNRKFSISEASKLAVLAIACTNEDPTQRPTMEEAVRDLNLINERNFVQV